jgi:5-hydroxyisourate hydrolase
VSAVSTHILDTVTGEPARGIVVRLERADRAGTGPSGAAELGRRTTDTDGRISDFGIGSLPAGTYRLIFETATYLAAAHPAESAPFFPEVAVTFSADGRRLRYHVPLLLSPYSYSTYRGS